MRRSSNIWSPKRWFKMWKCCIRYHDVFSLTCVFRVADGKRALLDLLLKQVLFVEEQDDGRVCEPLVVADAVKQLHALMHSVLKAKHRKEAISSAIHKRRDPDMIHLRFSIYHHFCLQKENQSNHWPSPHPRPAPGRNRSAPRRRWWPSRPQSSGSTSSSRIADRRRRTFWWADSSVSTVLSMK